MFLFRRALRAWLSGTPIWAKLSRYKNGETETAYSRIEEWGYPVWVAGDDGVFVWDCSADFYIYPEEEFD